MGLALSPAAAPSIAALSQSAAGGLGGRAAFVVVIHLSRENEDMLNGVKIFGACALVSLLAACEASGYATFEHPELSDEQAQIDARACGATQNVDGEGLTVSALNQAAFDECMKAKGYTFKYL